MIVEGFSNQAALTRLPILPWGNDAFSAAVRSVNRRGFHETLPEMARDARVMAQLLRLIEEMGEYVTASPWDAISEGADVVIVGAQIVWLLGEDVSAPLDTMFDAITTPEPSELMMLGELGRALRTGRIDDAVFWTRCIMFTIQHTFGADKLNAAIVTKLAADEGRGHLHNGSPLVIPATNGGA